MAFYKIKFWKLSILPCKCFHILPKTKTNSISPIISVMLWHIPSCLVENLDFMFLKWYFAQLKSNTSQFGSDLCVWLVKMNKYLIFEMWDRFQYSVTLSKMVSCNYPFEKKLVWGNCRTCLAILHHDFKKNPINVNLYACNNLFFNKDDEI